MSENNESSFERYTKELLRMYRLNQKNLNNDASAPDLQNADNFDSSLQTEQNRTDPISENRRQTENDNLVFRDDGVSLSDSALSINQRDDGEDLINEAQNNSNEGGSINDSLLGELGNGDYYKIEDAESNNAGQMGEEFENTAQNRGNAKIVDKSKFLTEPESDAAVGEEDRTATYGTDKEYSDMESFIEDNPSNGFIKVEVQTARGALPVPGARCLIYRKIGEENHVFHDLITDESGNTETVPVPTPILEESFEPFGKRPYQTYNLEVKKQGFRGVINERMSVFPGIISIQPVMMQPLTEDEKYEPPEIFIEQRVDL